MNDLTTIVSEPLSPERRRDDKTTVFGFWVYLMTDALLFASLFATYAVLHINPLNAFNGADLFKGPFILIETLVLLTSSFTAGLGIHSAYRNSKAGVISWFTLTWLLGGLFIVLEVIDFHTLIAAGHGWWVNGFLSSYFVLVGTHGLHVLVGLLWILLLVVSIISKGLTRASKRRLMLASLFWHFLDVIWIFIFTLVYLMALK